MARPYGVRKTVLRSSAPATITPSAEAHDRSARAGVIIPGVPALRPRSEKATPTPAASELQATSDGYRSTRRVPTQDGNTTRTAIAKSLAFTYKKLSLVGDITITNRSASAAVSRSP